MEIGNLQTLITSLGFPIVACVVLVNILNKKDLQYQEDRKSERETLLDEIAFNRAINGQLLEANKELLKTNKVLTEEIRLKLAGIADGIQEIKAKG